jgi:hypothetical protein
METVFHASIAVEAHLVRHLLVQAGIPSRIDGEYLQGASGELPPGGLVKVRVAPEHAAEAREIIAEWEKSQPPDPQPAPVTANDRKPARSWAPYTLVLGLALGFGAAWVQYRTPITTDGVDFDGDGNREETYHYAGSHLSSAEYDRNSDGRTDVRYEYDSHGVTSTSATDEDFDGRFENRWRWERGNPVFAETDRDGDGFAEIITHFSHGVPTDWEYLSPTTHAVTKRSHLKGGQLAWSEYDDDGDGQFERRVSYDERDDPKGAQ